MVSGEAEFWVLSLEIQCLHVTFGFVHLGCTHNKTAKLHSNSKDTIEVIWKYWANNLYPCKGA